MKINLLLLLLVAPNIVMAESLVDKIVTIEPGKKEIITIETSQSVSVDVAFNNITLERSLKCGNCLHLSQQMQDGYVPQTNSSNYEVGFIKATPENNIVGIIVRHDYNKPMKVEIKIDAIK